MLLADSDLASRLTLNSILTAAGYAVDCAATAGEAIGRLDANEYQLVLADLAGDSASDLGGASGERGTQLLAYARQKEFRPATALISSKMSSLDGSFDETQSLSTVRISDENVSYLLARVAELIGHRAGRRIRAQMRRVS